MSVTTTDIEAVFAELERIGVIATGLVDGEEAKAIVTDLAMHHIVHPTPEFRFMSADYYDVDHAVFLRMKKLLMRIERLSELAVCSALWLPVPESDDVTVIVQNGPTHRYYIFGQTSQPTPPEMKRVLDTGEPVRAAAGDGDKCATVLVPIRDSLGDTAAVLELSTPLNRPPAWA